MVCLLKMLFTTIYTKIGSKNSQGKEFIYICVRFCLSEDHRFDFRKKLGVCS